MINSHKDDIWHMTTAYKEAENAFRIDEVPIGAVIVDQMGRVVAHAHNIKEDNNDPCGHAEILAIRKACQKLKNWRLTGCTLYVTLEPCPMCLSAMLHARVDRLVFGAYDPKGGALSLGYNMYKDQRLNHNFKVTGGIEHFNCSNIVSKFFRQKRGGYKNVNKFK